MKSGSWASYRAAMPPECFGEPDDDVPNPKDALKSWGPIAVTVVWMGLIPCVDEHGCISTMRAPCGRVFGAEPWCWKHVVAWKEAMERRHGVGHVWIEEVF